MYVTWSSIKIVVYCMEQPEHGERSVVESRDHNSVIIILSTTELIWVWSPSLGDLQTCCRRCATTQTQLQRLFLTQTHQDNMAWSTATKLLAIRLTSQHFQTQTWHMDLNWRPTTLPSIKFPLTKFPDISMIHTYMFMVFGCGVDRCVSQRLDRLGSWLRKAMHMLSSTSNTSLLWLRRHFGLVINPYIVKSVVVRLYNTGLFNCVTCENSLILLSITRIWVPESGAVGIEAAEHKWRTIGCSISRYYRRHNISGLCTRSPSRIVTLLHGIVFLLRTRKTHDTITSVPRRSISFYNH